MNKAPAFQFYVGDYLQDTRCLSLAARGAWVDCLCAMWRSSTRGVITYPLVGFARLFGCTVDQARAVIDELVEMQICEIATADDAKVTLINRRMKREAEERNRANSRQLRYKDRQRAKDDASDDGKDDGKAMPYSSSSSSSSINPINQLQENTPPLDSIERDSLSVAAQVTPQNVSVSEKPNKKSAHKSEKLELAATIREIFSYWQTQMGHPDAKLLDKRRKAIENRLKEGYTAEDLKQAIDGCKASPFHQGQGVGSDGTVYDDIELICRNGQKVESFKAKLAGRPNGGRAHLYPINGTGRITKSDRNEAAFDEAERLIFGAQVEAGTESFVDGEVVYESV